MNSRFIDTEQARGMAIKYLGGLPLPFHMTISEGNKRSLKQNRLQFKWIADIARDLPQEDRDGWQRFCKLNFGVPVRRLHDEEFREVYDTHIRPFSYETKLEMMGAPIDLPVTRDLNVKPMAEYLTKIRDHFTELGVELTDPDQFGLDHNL